MGLSGETTLVEHIEAFRRKFYLNRIIRGAIILSLLFSSILLLLILGEGFFGFSSGVRTALFYSLLLGFVLVLGWMVVYPLSQMMKLASGIGEMDVAQMIRRHFPEIDDKLINLIQLKEKTHPSHSLAIAAIEKKTEELSPIPFARAINLNLNLRFARYLLIPVGLYLLFALVANSMLTDGFVHLINYKKDFPKPLPYHITVKNHPALLVSGEAFKLEAEVAGRTLPGELFLYLKKDSDPGYVNYPMTKDSPDAFEFQFSDIKENFSYYIGNDEVQTESYQTEVLRRPSIRNFRIRVQYPGYTGLKPDTLPENIGDLKALKGSEVSWLLDAGQEVSRAVYFGSDTLDFSKDGDAYRISRKIAEDETYFISLTSNRNVHNADTVRYHIEVMNDRYPAVMMNQAADQFEADFDLLLPIDFEITDDFGFTKLSLNYRYLKSTKEEKVSKEFSELPLVVLPKMLMQRKSLEVDLSQIGIEEGDKIEYFIKVWDNDYVSGPKSSVSGTFTVNYKSIEEKYEEVGDSQEKIEGSMDKLSEQLKDIGERYEKMKEKMLSQKNLSYDDRKELKSLMSKQQEITEQMQNLQKQFEQNKEKLQNNQMISEKTLEKYEKLNELMKKMDNPLLEKLMKNLQENMEKLSPEEIRKQMDQMQMNEEEMQKSIERTMELLKQLEVQQKLEEVTKKLDNLQKKQDMLNEKLNKGGNPEQMKDLKEKQDALNKEFQDLKKEIEELQKMKEDTQTPDQKEMEDVKQDANEAQKEMENSSSEMQKNSKQGASKSQKNASSKMSQMKQKLEEMQASSDMEQDQANLENLREILENLLRLSFDQEDLRDKTRDLRFSDPQINEKARDQKKLSDDMEMLRDSLYALAKKAFQIEKFVLDESRKIVENMQQSETALNIKNASESAKYQHIAMTSMNNLANMLADAMQQMQQQMKNSGKSSSTCKKPGGGMPNMKKMGEQQRELNGAMKEMMEKMSGKGADPKKLAEMAARQELIRQQLKEAHEQIQKEGGKTLGNMGQVMEDMKKSEDELKNNQLTIETLMRQEKILNRLLDATKAVREKEEFEERRESNTAKEMQRKSPQELDMEELQNLIRQEMLKTNQMEYAPDFIQLIERYFQLLEHSGKP